MASGFSAVTTEDASSSTESLSIIAQPGYTARLRYRSDFYRDPTRQGTLRSKNNPNYSGPAIFIPRSYFNATQQYYVRVCLTTSFHEQHNCHFIHPYELEDTRNETYNDRRNNCVWFPIEDQSVDFIKTFSNLRVVKLKAEDLKNYDSFRVFDSPDARTVPQVLCPKDTIKEFKLETAHLAFTMGRKIFNNGIEQYIPFVITTVFSDLLVEKTGKQESDTTSGESPTTRPRRPICPLHKYAPRRGLANENTEVLMFFKKGLKTKTRGELQITFEYHTDDIDWCEPVLDLEIEGQMLSFRTPIFPYEFTSVVAVDVVLKQRKQDFEQLKFEYLAPPTGGQYQQDSNLFVQTYVNKRSLSELYPSTTDPSSALFDESELTSLSPTNMMTTSKKAFISKLPEKKDLYTTIPE